MKDLWSILILFLITQGVFVLSVLLLFPKRRKKIENRYLASIIIIFIWFLMEFYCIRNAIKIPANFFYGTRYGSWMIIGPLTYFFFKAVSNSELKLRLKDGLHFTPFIVLVFLVPYLSKETLSNRQIHYGMLAVFDHRPKTVTPFEYFYSTVFFLQFIHLGIYLIFNHIALKRYAKTIKSTYAHLNGTAWLFIFNRIFLLVLILISTYVYVLFASDIYSRDLDYLYVLPLGIFIYAMSYKISGVEWLKPTEETKRYQTSNLTPEHHDKLKQELEGVMLNAKPYLKNELRLKDLAEVLSSSTHHVSQVINESFESSFFDYINKYRIDEAKKIIQKNPNFTLLKVAFDAGFNNKTSFVNAFKKFERVTPSAYRKKILQK